MVTIAEQLPSCIIMHQCSRRLKSFAALRLQASNFAAFPLIFAAGRVSGDGTLQLHDQYGSATVNLDDGSASASAGNTGNKHALRTAHGWCMVLSFGMLIPIGIVVARAFKDMGPWWFQVHRAVQSFAYVLAIVGEAVDVIDAACLLLWLSEAEGQATPWLA